MEASTLRYPLGSWRLRRTVAFNKCHLCDPAGILRTISGWMKTSEMMEYVGTRIRLRTNIRYLETAALRRGTNGEAWAKNSGCPCIAGPWRSWNGHVTSKAVSTNLAQVKKKCSGYRSINILSWLRQSDYLQSKLFLARAYFSFLLVFKGGGWCVRPLF